MENHTTERQDREWRGMVRMAGLVLLLVGVLFVARVVWPERQAAAPQPFYYPDPTPIIITTENHWFSHNCIGWNVNC